LSNVLSLQVGASYTIEAYKYSSALKNVSTGHAPYYTFNPITISTLNGDLTQNITSTELN
jgi:hypothetical protein